MLHHLLFEGVSTCKYVENPTTSTRNMLVVIESMPNTIFNYLGEKTSQETVSVTFI